MMTVVNWTEKESVILSDLMKDRQMTDVGLVRQALRHYQDTLVKVKNGETCRWSGDAQRASDFSGRPVRKEPVVARKILAELLRRQRRVKKLVQAERDTNVYGAALASYLEVVSCVEAAQRVLSQPR